jgi:hypothetical protein
MPALIVVLRVIRPFAPSSLMSGTPFPLDQFAPESRSHHNLQWTGDMATRLPTR